MTDDPLAAAKAEALREFAASLPARLDGAWVVEVRHVMREARNAADELAPCTTKEPAPTREG